MLELEGILGVAEDARSPECLLLAQGHTAL